jgi:1-acyl-sn-glycerol-3-phosphate acyltransferase
LVRLGIRRFAPVPGTNTPEGFQKLRTESQHVLRRLGVTLDVVHAERVPATGGLIVMWNQETHLDHLILGAAIPRPFLSIYNNAVARVPGYGSHMRETGHVHVDRTDERQWRGALARAAELVRGGACFVVSPEGTRSRGGMLLPMKRGAFLFAEDANAPIVCATIIGGHDRMPRGSPVVRPGPLRVVFSEPIPAGANAGQDSEAQRIVAETFERTKRQYARGEGEPSNHA